MYRATLVTGEVVAVKVQRPDVLESVTLDLYVIRLLLLFISKNDSTRESALSILGVIDNWADRFLQELDYLQEAANGDRWVVSRVFVFAFVLRMSPLVVASGASEQTWSKRHQTERSSSIAAAS